MGNGVKGNSSALKGPVKRGDISYKITGIRIRNLPPRIESIFLTVTKGGRRFPSKTQTKWLPSLPIQAGGSEPRVSEGERGKGSGEGGANVPNASPEGGENT